MADNTFGPNTVAVFEDPAIIRAFRIIRAFVACYLGIGVVALAATCILRNNSTLVNGEVWGRSITVILSAGLLLLLTYRASRGVPRAYRRLRIVSALVPIAILVLLVTPGTYPLWVKLEQAACGLVLVGVAVIVNGRHLRAAFT